MGEITRDLREGLRRLLRSPASTLVAVATLTLGLAASTAVFTYVNAYAAPFPGAESKDLHHAWLASEEAPWGALSVPDFADLGRLDTSQYIVTGVTPSVFFASVRHQDLAEVAVGEAGAGAFFSVLGVQIVAGRGFTAEDDLPGAAPVAVLSHAYWTTRYGGSNDAIGRTILLNNEPYTIVGVAPPEFRGTSAASRPQFWIPLEQFLRVYRPGPAIRQDREVGVVRPIIRLAAGTSTTTAEDALGALAQGLDTEAPLADRTRRFVLTRATWIGPEARSAEASTTTVMMGAAAFLLLVACANVANLLLAAGAHRRSEMAIRRALGASGGRLIRKLLAESLLLCVPAGLLALVLAGPLSRRLSSYFARPSVWGANVPREIAVDPKVMGFALAAAVFSAFATGIVPAIRTSARAPAEALGTSGASGSARRPRTPLPGLPDLLVSGQIGMCVVLLFVAGLVLRSLDAASRIDPGFDTVQTVSSYVSTSSMGVPIPERHQFYEALIQRFDRLPWVEAATVAENAPLSGHPVQELRREDGSPVEVTVARVWPGYFEALGQEIVRGRRLLATDSVSAAGVVIVNETLAAQLSADTSALGRTLTWPGPDGEPDQHFEVVGVSRDARQANLLESPGPVAYFPLPQLYSRPGNALLLKVRGDPAAAVELMERELRAVDTRIAIVNILPYRDVVRGATYVQRMNAELFTIIAALGLLLSVAGVFGVLARAVASRTREIGIRVAVGASSAAVARSVLRPVGVAIAIGLTLGIVGALFATSMVGSLLWGVTPIDPVALSLGLGVLVAAIVPAVGLPLRRAMRIDAAAAVKAE